MKERDDHQKDQRTCITRCERICQSYSVEYSAVVSHDRPIEHICAYVEDIIHDRPGKADK